MLSNSTAPKGLRLYRSHPFDLPPDRQLQEPAEQATVVIRPSDPGKGKGVFAADHIRAASLILSDEALLSMGDGEDLPQLFDKYEALPLSDQLVFEDLCRVDDPKRDRDLAQKLAWKGYDLAKIRRMTMMSSHFTSNAFNFTPQEAEGQPPDVRRVWRRAVFPNVARINHSCKPNAHVHYRRESGSMLAFALRDISPGEEITISYFNIVMCKEDRQKRALKWGFTCLCQACVQSTQSEEHENLLARVRGVTASNSRLLLVPASSAELAGIRKAVESTMQLVRDTVEETWLKPQMPEMFMPPQIPCGFQSLTLHSYEQLGTLLVLASNHPSGPLRLDITPRQAFQLAIDAEISISGINSSSSRRRRRLLRSAAASTR